jgi:hypothetical protein
VERLSGLAFLQPDKQDHIAAAEIRNACRRQGVQIGTIDALLIQLSRLVQRQPIRPMPPRDHQAAARRHRIGIGDAQLPMRSPAAPGL